MFRFGDEEKVGLSADDLAFIAAVVVVIGDILGLFAVIAAKRESKDENNENKHRKRNKIY